MKMGKGTDTLFDSRETEESKAVRKMFHGGDRVETLAEKFVMHPGECGEHVRRTREITKYLLKSTPAGENITPELAGQIDIGVILHDVGKLVIPASILKKSGKLTREEYEIVKTHTIYGTELLKKIPCFESHPAFDCVYDIVRHHHERWDGRGYPDGLKGNEISVSVQVMSMADVYDALVTKRTYKDAYDHDKAVQMMVDGECGTFNPEMLQYFLDVEPELRKFYEDRSNRKETNGNQE